MRKILFRARDINREWLYGEVHNLTSEHPCIHSLQGSTCGIDKNTVGQFIGLHDKNGKNIYEGDIVHLDSWSPYAMQVVFMEGAFCLADKDGNFLGDIHYIHHGGIEQCTIIGNIHDNPELLKGGNV